MNKFLNIICILAISILPLKADIIVSNWDGYSAPDIMETFKEATGVNGEMAFHATNEEVMGKVTASGGKGYDVLFVSSLESTIPASDLPGMFPGPLLLKTALDSA